MTETGRGKAASILRRKVWTTTFTTRREKAKHPNICNILQCVNIFIHFQFHIFGKIQDNVAWTEVVTKNETGLKQCGKDQEAL